MYYQLPLTYKMNVIMVYEQVSASPANLTLPKGGPLMKFSDFFIPKIARSDPKVREQAVMECQDKELLKRVIQNDKDEHVRQVAQQRLQALSA
jgi:hypothetical protein